MPQQGTSTKKGAKPRQKYQNTVAFHHNKNSKLTKKILAAPITGLCRKCFEIVDWRKKYRKYKPLTVPKKCVSCETKAVTEAYHVICPKCAEAKNICAKCLKTEEIVEDENIDHGPSPAEIKRHEDILATMNERHRRTYLRKMEKGLVGLLTEPVKPESDSDDFDDFDDDFDDESD